RAGARRRVDDRDRVLGVAARAPIAVGGVDDDLDRVTVVAVAGGRQVERGGGGACDEIGRAACRVDVAEGVVAGVGEARRRHGEGLVGGRAGWRDRHRAGARRRVDDRDRVLGVAARAPIAVGGVDDDLDRVTVVAVAGGRQVERGGGGACDGDAALVPLVDEIGGRRVGGGGA